MQLGHSKAYEGLALWAGREVGMDPPALAAVAENPDARDVRDAAWAAYRRMLSDKTSYPIAAVRAWLLERGVEVSDASVSRDRAPVAAREERLNLSSELTHQFLAATAGADEAEVLTAARKRAAQLLFETLLKFDAEGLAAALEAGDVIGLADSIGKLSRAHAETGLLAAKLADLQRKLDAAKAEADKKAQVLMQSRDIDPDTIDRIRAIYGLPKLAEVA